MEDEIWTKITTSLKIEQKLELLYMSKKSQSFIIDEIDPEYIRIKFENSKKYLRINKSRFISAYNLLSQKINSWVLIGASRNFIKPATLEGVIKKDFDGKENGLATAAWIAAIFVKVLGNIEFNGKAIGQAVRLKS